MARCSERGVSCSSRSFHLDRLSSFDGPVLMGFWGELAKEEMLDARLGDRSTGCDCPCGNRFDESAGEVA